MKTTNPLAGKTAPFMLLIFAFVVFAGFCGVFSPEGKKERRSMEQADCPTCETNALHRAARDNPD